ncbi:TadE/TadG family type IV pilus assembly protein [Streptomyces sp. NPDC003247]|uniref:TadE/TadG family type IV pilus assembly protein n=1 Tax=Streptomyces sp. NPDC003247 TaxID=3364677 RepID=UPI00368233E5
MRDGCPDGRWFTPRGGCRDRDRDRVRDFRRDRGQVALEYLGFVPVLLLVALAAVQLGLIAYTAQQAGTAARAGARSASLDKGAQQACQGAVSSWLAGGTNCTSAGLGDEVRVTAGVTIPSVIPGIGDFGQARKTATMPVDH